MRLEGKVAIITGSASGIGRGMALALAKEGAHVAIVDINEETGKKTLAEINQHTEGMLFTSDKSQRANVECVVSEVVNKRGELDILINNALASTQASFVETNQEMFDLWFGTRFDPTFNVMQVAYPEQKKSKGKV